MSRQTPGQRWCSLVLLAVFLSLFLYYGLPSMAWRIGRAIEAGRRDGTRTMAEALPPQAPPSGLRAAPFVRASQDVRAAVVHVDADHPLDGPGAEAAADGSAAPPDGPTGGLRIEKGCGVVIDSQGLVLTCRRIVTGARQVRVVLAQDKRPLVATIAASDARTDLAILKFDPPAGGVAAVRFPAVGQLAVGDFVVAVGNAYHPGEFLWVGVVNACGRPTSPACCDQFDCIQTAAVNPWNCGAPLVDLHGAVVGINTSLGDADGFPTGLAIPAATAWEVVAQLRHHREVNRGWLGLFLHKISISPELTASTELPVGALTVAVDYVVPGSPAAKGGIRAGDVIVKFDGLPFYSATELRRRIAGASPNDAIALTLVRGGVLDQASVVVGRQPVTPPLLPGEREWGLRLLGQLSVEESGRLIVDGREGVAVREVEPHGKGRALFPHDVIRSVNDVATPNLEVFCREVTRLLESPSREKVRLHVSTQGNTRSVEIVDE